MKLLTNEEYKTIENYLYDYNNLNNAILRKSIDELKKFFEDRPHKYFLEKYYINKNKHLTKSGLLRKICKDLYIEEPTRI